MDKIIVRYNEIYLKGKNRHVFEKLLKDNVRNALSEIACDVVKIPTRIIIENYEQSSQGRIIKKLKNVLGVYSCSVATVIDCDLENIKKVCIEKVNPDNKKFRVTVKRADKTFPINSLELSKILGVTILEKFPNMTVDLYNFSQEIYVEIREDKSAYIFSDIVKCRGGLPVGCSGEGLLMLSGGIDSPVAGYMMGKRGMRISALHFHSYPYTSEMAKQKVISLAKIMKDYLIDIPLYIVPFTEIQTQIHQNCPSELMIILMRRFMMRIANSLCKKINSQAVITGENLAQVASQTVESITASNILCDFPIFRPLIGFDKIDIIEIANDIQTYETSIQPYEDCCTVFLPKKPVIKPKLNILEKAEEKLNIDELIKNAIDNIELIKI